jgi:hypothetical protein
MLEQHRVRCKGRRHATLQRALRLVSVSQAGRLIPQFVRRRI